jgi:hypothetical protein
VEEMGDDVEETWAVINALKGETDMLLKNTRIVDKHEAPFKAGSRFKHEPGGKGKENLSNGSSRPQSGRVRPKSGHPSTSGLEQRVSTASKSTTRRRLKSANAVSKKKRDTSSSHTLQGRDSGSAGAMADWNLPAVPRVTVEVLDDDESDLTPRGAESHGEKLLRQLKVSQKSVLEREKPVRGLDFYAERSRVVSQNDVFVPNPHSSLQDIEDERERLVKLRESVVVAARVDDTQRSDRATWVAQDRAAVELQRIFRGGVGRRTAALTQRVQELSDPSVGDWIEVRDRSNGDTWYYNRKSGESSWERPNEMRTALFAPGGIRSLSGNADAPISKQAMNQNQSQYQRPFSSMAAISGSSGSSSGLLLDMNAGGSGGGSTNPAVLRSKSAMPLRGVGGADEASTMRKSVSFAEQLARGEVPGGALPGKDDAVEDDFAEIMRRDGGVLTVDESEGLDGENKLLEPSGQALDDELENILGVKDILPMDNLIYPDGIFKPSIRNVVQDALLESRFDSLATVLADKRWMTTKPKGPFPMRPDHTENTNNLKATVSRRRDKEPALQRSKSLGKGQMEAVVAGGNGKKERNDRRPASGVPATGMGSRKAELVGTSKADRSRRPMSANFIGLEREAALRGQITVKKANKAGKSQRGNIFSVSGRTVTDPALTLNNPPSEGWAAVTSATGGDMPSTAQWDASSICFGCWVNGRKGQCGLHVPRSGANERPPPLPKSKTMLLCRNWDIGILRRRYRSEEIQEIFGKRSAALQYDVKRKKFLKVTEERHMVYRLLAKFLKRFNMIMVGKERGRRWAKSFRDVIRCGTVLMSSKARAAQMTMRLRRTIVHHGLVRRYSREVAEEGAHPIPPTTGYSHAERIGEIQYLIEHLDPTLRTQVEIIIDGPIPRPVQLYMLRKFVLTSPICVPMPVPAYSDEDQMLEVCLLICIFFTFFPSFFLSFFLSRCQPTILSVTFQDYNFYFCLPQTSTYHLP